MTIFLIIAALLVAICLIWLLLGLFRASGSSTDQEAINISLARERGDVLSVALADGSIDQDTYQEERNQLDLDLANDLTLIDKKSKSSQLSNIVAAVLVALFVPLTAGALYSKLGDPAAISRVSSPNQVSNTSVRANGASNASGRQLPGPLAELLPKLEERLEADPNDIEGWRLLGRSYISIQDYNNAQRALEAALALDENHVGTLAQLAESIAMSKGGDLSGESMELLERSVAINPRHEHSLWLRSIGKQQLGEHQEALVGFNLLMGLARDNQDALATIDQMRSRSIQALGTSSVRQSVTNSQAASGETSVPAESESASITVNVAISDTAASGSSDEQSVFIYATATDGPPMPLAVVRLSVQDLPTTVVLDDSQAMIPTMKLSSFEDVTVGARVSKSGNPIAQTGDWFNETESVNIANTPSVTLVIDQQTP